MYCENVQPIRIKFLVVIKLKNICSMFKENMIQNNKMLVYSATTIYLPQT